MCIRDRSAPTWPYTVTPWFAPQLAITLYTSWNAPFPVRRGANHVVGHVRSVRRSMGVCTSSGRLAVQPSAICSTGPTPSAMLTRSIVTGISAVQRKWLENPPPRKYS